MVAALLVLVKCEKHQRRYSIGQLFGVQASKFFSFISIVLVYTVCLRIICADGKILSAVKPFHAELLLTALRIVNGNENNLQIVVHSGSTCL